MNAIVVMGNPLSGFSYYGPFANRAVAHAWATENFGANDWWVALLHSHREEDES